MRTRKIVPASDAARQHQPFFTDHSGFFQAKAVSGQPGDAFEQEADHMADSVTGRQGVAVEGVQRAAEKQEDEKPVQAQAEKQEEEKPVQAQAEKQEEEKPAAA